MRHLISGDDCAIAGEATAAPAAPTADTFKKSRRFIQSSPYGGVSRISRAFLSEKQNDASTEAALAAVLTRKFGNENATKA
jgi:hypothetical protein